MPAAARTSSGHHSPAGQSRLRPGVNVGAPLTDEQLFSALDRTLPGIATGTGGQVYQDPSHRGPTVGFSMNRQGGKEVNMNVPFGTATPFGTSQPPAIVYCMAQKEGRYE